MTTEPRLQEQLEAVATEDGRYSPTAYRFIFDSLDYILIELGREHLPIGNRHITVDQLLEGIKQCALDHFGPLSRIVFEYWGVQRTEDIGEIVFNLVECGLLNKQESDLKADFADVFDFRDVFEDQYTPEIHWESPHSY